MSMKQKYTNMMSKRFHTRPLGHIVPESRVELQVEKALFKTNMRLLSDMITAGRYPQSLYSPYYQQEQTHNLQKRLFQTRSERLRKVNDAEYQAKYTTTIQDRVVSADQTRLDTLRLLQYQTTICDRHYRHDRMTNNNAHCDVLGPYYFTYCIQLKKRKTSAQTHQNNFPNIEVHPRSLVAPDKIDRVLMSREKLLLNGYMSPVMKPEIQATYDENVYLPVYTENEIHERLRNSLRDKSSCSSPRSPRSPLTTYRSSVPKELSASSSTLPLEMKVSVTFAPNKW
ncbi:Hypothetical predicted protein [Mytilus galloprovincialis]|uniref:Uncharacterized protein n=2 Tax=Mytilus galloprovincialis TaxID=29158 RepID=A0A8B6FH02_MYTGA|nr:Hypothetical predicted protein [Mytilus galloprovincialis]